MQVGVMEQVRAPGVEHGKKADLGAEVLGISGDGEQGLRRGSKQDAVELPLVLIGNRCNLFRYGKDHVGSIGYLKARLGDPGAIELGPATGIWDSADPSRSCKRCADGRTDYTAPGDRQAQQSGRPRWQS